MTRCPHYDKGFCLKGGCPCDQKERGCWKEEKIIKRRKAKKEG